MMPFTQSTPRYKKTLIYSTILGLTIFPALASAMAMADDLYGAQTYDIDGDGVMSQDEYLLQSYDMIDYNNDQGIDQDEWTYYSEVWYEPHTDIEYDVSRSFDYYDQDNDGMIEMSEYERAGDMDIYNRWDIDNDGYVEAVEYDNAASIIIDYDNDNLYEW